jgi:hypothetical protein
VRLVCVFGVLCAGGGVLCAAGAAVLHPCSCCGRFVCSLIRLFELRKNLNWLTWRDFQLSLALNIHQLGVQQTLGQTPRVV